MLFKQIVAATHASSYSVGQLMLEKLGGITVSSRGLNKTAAKIGTEMVQARDARVDAYFEQPLPRQHTQPPTPVDLASVSVDGGRIQTREQGEGPGVHLPHWRESKNALFSRMKSECFPCDPHPELPHCFADPQQMGELLSGVAEGSQHDATKARSVAPPESAPDKWHPERLFRTCLSSLEDSDTFGRMMEVEADVRGFYHARKKAFVCDGLPYNWTIQQRHFREFTPILDFVHAVERLYEAARAIHGEATQRWEDYVRWARQGWQGHIAEVIDELRTHQQRLGRPPQDCEKTDPCKILADTIGYLENNASRMNYPQYRCQGLPTTSAHMESLVKEINARVKGTEKFWNDGPSGEAILQLRAAVLSDDERLDRFLRNRPGHPFHPNVPRANSLAIAP